MATTVTYKGQTLTTVENQTKTLQTAGTWMEGDLTLTDVTQGGGGGEWTTDGIANLTEPNGSITISSAVTTVGERALYKRTGITSLTIEGNPYLSNYCFASCTALTQVNAPNLTSFLASRYGTGSYLFQGCSALRGIVLPKFGASVVDSYVFQNCSALAYADFANMQRLGGAFVFANTALNLLVIRKTDGVVPLQNINIFNGTPFSSGGTGGTLYVPQALISGYEQASNWSTILGYANNQILPIEGSYYETHYADGTVIA